MSRGEGERKTSQWRRAGRWNIPRAWENKQLVLLFRFPPLLVLTHLCSRASFLKQVEYWQ